MNLRERQRERERRRRRRRRIVFVIFLAIVALITALCMSMCGGGEEPVSEPVASPEAIMPTGEPEPTPTPLPANADEAIAAMTLDEKLMQLFAVDIDSITGVENTTIHGSTSSAAITDNVVGAIVYDAGNFETKPQVYSMLNALQTQYKEENGFKALLAVAEEGGENSPLASVGIGENIGDIYAFTEGDNFEGAYNAGLGMGEALAQVGFNLNLAPDCEVGISRDAESVSSVAISLVDGLRESGVKAAYKSFPGTPATTVAELSDSAILPFRTAISAGAEVMMVKRSAVRSSEIVTTMLRSELDFDGVVMTEEITADMCIQAIAAGCDLLYVPAEYKDGVQKLRNAIAMGTLTEERINESVRRILNLKYSI